MLSDYQKLFLPINYNDEYLSHSKLTSEGLVFDTKPNSVRPNTLHMTQALILQKDALWLNTPSVSPEARECPHPPTKAVSTDKAGNTSHRVLSFSRCWDESDQSHYPMLARKELPGPVGDLGLSCSSYTGGGIAALEDWERGLESSS